MGEPIKEDASLMNNSFFLAVRDKDFIKTNLRYCVLVFASLLNLGNFFVYDNPAALQTQLENSLGIDSIEYNLLYSVYSFPNIILPIFGGYLVDRIGSRSSNLVFTVLIAVGQALFAFSVTINLYPIALVGRVIFGLGGENLNISQFNTISMWMNKNELSMALSIAATTNRLSTVLNDNLSPTVAETISLSFSLWLGFMLCGFSILMACILSHIDKKKERFLRNQNNLKLQTEEKFNIKDIKNFSFSFWLLALNCTFVYAAVYCFNNIASNLFQKRFGYSTVEAGHIISITYIICALFCPVIGVLLDKYGQRVYFIMISGLLVCLSHVLFFSTADSNKPIAPILYMIPIGLGFSINTSVVWSSISYVVEKGSGTAYGIILAMINTGLVVIPILVGYIEENTSEYKGYYWVSVLLAVISAFGVLNSLILFCVNKRSGGKLFARTPLVTF